MGKKKEKDFMISAHIYGIFDTEKKELIKVSLDEDDIEMELALQTDEKLTKCEFGINLVL